MASPESRPGAPTVGWCDVGELHVRYLDWGGDGPPVIALHGLASSAHWYDLVVPHLREDYRVVVPDQRGHGQTTQSSSGYDWRTLASDVVGLADSLGLGNVALLGHSWGGNVATNVAARFPEKVNAVVMIDGGFLNGRIRPGATWEAFRDRVRPRDVSGTRQEFLDRLREQLADCWSVELEGIVQTMVYEGDDGQIRDILHPDNHAQVIRQMWDEPPPVTLPRISCRTLIVAAKPRPDRVGSEFALMREEMVQAAAGALRDTRVHWMADTSHDIGYYQPRELARVINEFLAEG